MPVVIVYDGTLSFLPVAWFLYYYPCFCVLGEGLLQGGWIVFDTDGVPRAAFQEDAKQRVPIDEIVDEVKKLSVSK